MRPSFHPRTVNGPFEDPVLFIPFLFENRAILFDLGDIYALSPRDILKISHVFVSHTHMDHFVGFDRLLRLLLGREKRLYLYGPQGFIDNVEGKLAGYSWNLVGNYTHRFTLDVTEVHEDRLVRQRYRCRDKFIPAGPTAIHPFNDRLLEEPAFAVTVLLLDHSLPCLGFSIEERFHVNIIKDRLQALGFDIGPWLKTFKQALYDLPAAETEFTVDDGKHRQTFVLKDLGEQIATISPGQKITYITDAAYSRTNRNKIVAFAADSDHLFIEAAFLDGHRDIAAEKYHLTAKQAGTIAGLAQVKQFTIFHFSPRYTDADERLYQEAQEAYQEAKGLRAYKQ